MMIADPLNIHQAARCNEIDEPHASHVLNVFNALPDDFVKRMHHLLSSRDSGLNKSLICTPLMPNGCLHPVQALMVVTLGEVEYL